MLEIAQEKVLDLFQTLQDENQTSQWLPFQKQAWSRLLKKGLPERKEEAFQYVSIRKLYETLLSPKEPFVKDVLEISSFVLPESQNSYLVFKDGRFCPELSILPPSLVVLSLEEALKSSYSSFLKHRLNLLIEQEEDPWALLNAALCKQGAFIYAPPKTCLESPLQVIHIQSNSDLFYVGPRIHLFLGSRAEMTMVSSFQGAEGVQMLYNDFLDVSLEEKSIFSHVFSTKRHCPSWGFSSFRASLKKESHLNSNFVTFGSPGFRRDYSISLLGERAEADLKGLTALGPSLESHVHIHMDHAAPSCRSNQFFKNVLGSQSRSSFTGKIYVKQIAQKTEAYQLNQNLLLSDEATVNTKPNLEIFADDVKASHGATVSQIDEEQVFYLRTRGVPEQEAKTLLTIGFCQEILDSISVESLRKDLSEKCRQFLLEQA